MKYFMAKISIFWFVAGSPKKNFEICMGFVSFPYFCGKKKNANIYDYDPQP